MTKSTTPKKKKPFSHIQKEIKPLINSHAMKIGKICWAWNTLHTQLLFCFAEVVDRSNMFVGMNIWDSAASDSAQRNMLKIAAKARFNKDSQLLGEIQWICNQIDHLAGLRNFFIHTPVGYIMKQGEEKVIPSVIGMESRYKKYESFDNNELFNALYGDLDLLTNYTNNLNTNIGLWLKDNSWQIKLLPQPSLQCPLIHNHHQNKTPQGNRKKAPQLRPQSSRQKSPTEKPKKK